MEQVDLKRLLVGITKALEGKIYYLLVALVVFFFVMAGLIFYKFFSPPSTSLPREPIPPSVPQENTFILP